MTVGAENSCGIGMTQLSRHGVDGRSRLNQLACIGVAEAVERKVVG